MLEMVCDPTSPAELKFIDLLHNLVIPHVKLVIEFVGVNGIEYLRAERNSRIRLDARLVDLQKFIFSDRCHLAASTLARVCPSMTGLMVWITSFNRYRTSPLLLLLNFFLKVTAEYFKEDSTISGAFQY